MQKRGGGVFCPGGGWPGLRRGLGGRTSKRERGRGEERDPDGIFSSHGRRLVSEYLAATTKGRGGKGGGGILLRLDINKKKKRHSTRQCQ